VLHSFGNREYPYLISDVSLERDEVIKRIKGIRHDSESNISTILEKILNPVIFVSILPTSSGF